MTDQMTDSRSITASQAFVPQHSPGTSRKLRVTVLMGGNSSERPISLRTGNMIVNALDAARYEVTAIDTRDLALLARAATPALPSAEPIRGETIATDGVAALAPAAVSDRTAEPEEAQGGRQRPDVVFIALHGKGGEDGAVQGMMEVLGLRYTGSGILASALAMDKQMAKRTFQAAGIPVIPGLIISRAHRPADEDLIAAVTTSLGGFPVFVKPNAEGSTFGCSLVHGAEELGAAVAKALEYDRLALIETYIRGRELTVGVLGNAGGPLESLPVVEIVPRGEYYDYDSKYADGGSEHIIPARLSPEQTRQAQEYALRCHELLGCRGMSRTDLIARDDSLYVLEVNTIPGMTPTSLLPQAAAHAGISFAALLDRVIQDALNS